MKYHDRVMNLSSDGYHDYQPRSRVDYAAGYWDARYAAADIASKADAVIERLRRLETDIQRVVEAYARTSSGTFTASIEMANLAAALRFVQEGGSEYVQQGA